MKSVLSRTAALLVVLSCIGFGQTAAATPEDLMKQILTALEAKDQSTLETLTITDGEYKKYLWPMLAANNPGATPEKLWALHQRGSAAGIAAHLKDFGGRRLQLVKVSFGPPIKQTKKYSVLSAPTVSIRDKDGQEKTIRLAGALLEHDGAYKVSTYYVTPTASSK